MTEFYKQIIVLILDKGLLALIITIFGFAAKRYLDRLNAQSTYKQKLADERIGAYKEISRIVSHQVQMMVMISHVLDQPNDTQAAKDKLAADFTECWHRLVNSYHTKMPKLQADLIFVSSEVADHLIAYIEAFGAFGRIPRCMARGETTHPPDRSIIDIAGKLQHALGEEINDFRVGGPCCLTPHRQTMDSHLLGGIRVHKTATVPVS